MDGYILQAPPEQDTDAGALSLCCLDDADLNDLLVASHALKSATGNENALPGFVLYHNYYEFDLCETSVI